MEENLSLHGGELDYYIFKVSNAPRLAGRAWAQLELTDTLVFRCFPATDMHVLKAYMA